MAQGATEYMSRLERQEVEEAAKRKRYRLTREYEVGPDSSRLSHCVRLVAQLTHAANPIIVAKVRPWLWDMMKDWHNYELDVRQAVIRTAIAGQRVEIRAVDGEPNIQAYFDGVSVECHDTRSGEQYSSDEDWRTQVEEITP